MNMSGNMIIWRPVSTAGIRIPQEAKPKIDLSRLLRAYGIRIVSRTQARLFAAVRELNIVPAKLNGLMKEAEPYNLSFEIEGDLQLSVKTLERMLEFGIREAKSLQEKGFLKSFDVKVSLNDVKGTLRLIVMPRTEAREAEEIAKLVALQQMRLARSSMDSILSGSEVSPSIEEHVAKVLVANFGAVTIKVYDVAVDGSVRLSHAYGKNVAENVVFVAREQVSSHFSGWVAPEEFVGEAMAQVVQEKKVTFLAATVLDPESDPRCTRNIRGERIEKNPFVLISEIVDGKPVKVYKVDFKDAKTLQASGTLSIQGVFVPLFEMHRRQQSEAENNFLGFISHIAASEGDLQCALKQISTKIAEYIRVKGEGHRALADRVTIMLYDERTDALVTRIVWTPNEIKKVEFYSSSEDKGMGRLIYELGSNVYIRNANEFNERRTTSVGNFIDGPDSTPPVAWRRGGKGSLIGSLVRSGEKKLGVIIVSSDQEDAFTQGDSRLLERISERVGPAFERIATHLQETQLDPKFRQEKFGSLKVYNPEYITARLTELIRLSRSQGVPLSVIFGDIDRFKDLNEAWVHDDVDYVLAGLLSRKINALRDGELGRHGGEETVIILPADLRSAVTVAQRVQAAVSLPLEIRVPYPSRMEVAHMIGEINRKKPTWPNHGIIKLEYAAGRAARPGSQPESFLKVTVKKTESLGVTTVLPGDTPETLIKRADAASQKAKTLGRDQITVDDGRGPIKLTDWLARQS